MAAPIRYSRQTEATLVALAEAPSQWRHGYDLAKTTGLKSGTLYPILIRLAERGLVEASWEAEQPAGRPRRHLYRLTADGLVAASAVQARTAAAATAPAVPSRSRPAEAARPAPPTRPASPGRGLAMEGM